MILHKKVNPITSLDLEMSYLPLATIKPNMLSLSFYILCRQDELDIYCMMVLANALKNALNFGTWFDTNIMYWWFEVLKVWYPDVYFYDPIICISLRRQNLKHHMPACLHMSLDNYIVLIVAKLVAI